MDLAKKYLEKGELNAETLKGDWIDAGTFESLYKASTIVRENDLGIMNPFQNDAKSGAGVNPLTI